MNNPYVSLPASAYWRSAVTERGADPDISYCTPKWLIARTDRIATAGSCFAQHIGKRLRKAGYAVIDAEPAPALLPPERHMAHGYGVYSGRYGNVYTARQMRQLAEEAFGMRPLSQRVWSMRDRFVDALRPTIDPEGHATAQAVLAHRRYHLDRVRTLLLEADLLVFTLGLTEAWEEVETGHVLPVCPGTVAGAFDPDRYRFRNFNFQDTWDDMLGLRAVLEEARRTNRMRMLLTVSPVPLTATASGKHVIQATTYSKAVLRAVAGQLTDTYDDIDYFPSYEIVSNPWAPGRRYASNMRSVLDTSVEMVMGTFMAIHADAEMTTPVDLASTDKTPTTDAEVQAAEVAMAVKCDEELLDAFGPRST